MRKKLLIILFLLFIVGLLIPQHFRFPLKLDSKGSYHPNSFWYFPWGKSVTHKGVDIFAKKGTSVFATTKGFVLYTGKITRGGNVVLVIGPKWRLHYFAHLERISTTPFSYITTASEIGTVGDTGNAKNKPPHLHYAIISLVPYVWLIDNDRQGWKKMFYLNPISYF